MNVEHTIGHLLVVEDNPGDFILLREYLQLSRFPARGIHHASSMGEAADYIRVSNPDIALLDLSLPDSSGIDSVITLNRLLPDVPIVVFSGHSDVEIAMEAISLGAQDYLVKGEFDEKLLGKAIHYSIERKKMVENLRQSHERYVFVNKATLDTIWEWHYASGSGTWGEGLIHTFGYSAGELDYKDNWIDVYIHPDDRDPVRISLQKAILNRQQHWQGKYRFRCADGSYKDVYDRGYLIYDEKGNPARMIGAMTDITEKLKLEKELAEQEIRQQKLITEVTIQAQEKERNEIGLELHDNINQVLATVKMYLSLSMSHPDGRPDLTAKSLDNVNYVIEEIRKLSKSLVSPSLGDIGLVEALQEMADEMQLAGGPAVELVNGITGDRYPDKNMELMLYRVAQEQLNNIRKYARATRVAITVSTGDKDLYFSVADNGIGFDTGVKARGIGLRNIASRVEFYAGTMHIISAPGKGCTLELRIPIQ